MSTRLARSFALFALSAGLVLGGAATAAAQSDDGSMAPDSGAMMHENAPTMDDGSAMMSDGTMAPDQAQMAQDGSPMMSDQQQMAPAADSMSEGDGMMTPTDGSGMMDHDAGTAGDGMGADANTMHP